MDTPISRAQTPNNASDDAAQRDTPDPPRRVVDDPIQTDATSYVVQPSPDDIEAITTRFRRLTGLRLCSWQAFVTAVCNTGKKDLFVLAPPGAGKTLAFLAPLIFNPHHIVVIICPLIALGSQHFKSCVALGISAIELTAKTATNANYKDIARCLFRVIIAPPEVANRDPRFVKLFKVNAFALRFYRVIADEVHCVEEWSDFRPQYLNFDLLLHWLPPRARFLCASATVTDALRARIMKTFRLQPKTTELIRLNNDCPNIFFAVRKMSGTPTNYNDLLSLLPSDPDLIAYDCPPPPKFMVFMPSKKECVEARLFLMHHLPLHSVGRICWFFSDCSEGYKNKMLQDLKDGKIWGMFCTDSAGMGIDVPDVRIVIQWGIKNVTFATLYQRIGRGGRDRSLQALALVYVENAHWPDDGKGKAPLKTSVKREAPDDEIPSKRVKIEEKEVR
ncbi:P-loop containing nucleoside triphosphate hydrolase protein [Exidia glandulosa HHB12029]|uniref:DNA 3'-5' helicase n=1 Tax=Exidia glandulosa HHB12029 TaxID=1314781 RepID=A0A165GKY6_EXIGL|nr:P-loop containing nucleoside triphosphate hydrolase protein [Exidia glandulosa HHB12029]